jgi:hypothetical protein
MAFSRVSLMITFQHWQVYKLQISLTLETDQWFAK